MARIVADVAAVTLKLIEKGIGAAWEVVADESTPDRRPDWDASIGLALLSGPWHPFWGWWAVAVVHLRDMPGVRPAYRQYPTAEYEFAIHSLDAGGSVGKPWDVERDYMSWSSRLLTPPDVVKHFDVGTTLPVVERDRVARAVFTSAVAGIVRGGVSPDSDFRSWWNAAIPRTVEHVLTSGQHPDGRAS